MADSGNTWATHIHDSNSILSVSSVFVAHNVD